jgi:serine-type D-Ala-D-Ala carboxypeptidase (penicillin-binding protein 5/6)
MNVVSPERYQPRPKRRKVWPFFVVPLALVTVVTAANYLRPLPAATVTINIKAPGTTKPSLAWPSDGQQAVAASGYGLLATNGTQTPLATASIAKVILALCILQKQPLTLSSSGPTYIMTNDDAALYETYAERGGSIMPVIEDEQLTEYQMLQALMIASADNIADSMAAKVFGGQADYATYANSYLLQHGLTQTHIGSDASGYDPSTTSTASDLTKLGLLALKSPVLMHVAGQKSTTLPVAGTVQNYNTVLGVSGITGLKTGNNDADPGALLFTANAHIGGQDIPLAGTVMEASDLDTALQDSTTLVTSLQKGFEQVALSKSGQSVGTMKTAWGASSPIVTTTPLTLVRWKATPLTEKHSVRTDVRSGQVGYAQIAAGQAKTISPLRLLHPISGPSFWWRLTRH